MNTYSVILEENNNESKILLNNFANVEGIKIELVQENKIKKINIIVNDISHNINEMYELFDFVRKNPDKYNIRENNNGMIDNVYNEFVHMKTANDFKFILEKNSINFTSKSEILKVAIQAKGYNILKTEDNLTNQDLTSKNEQSNIITYEKIVPDENGKLVTSRMTIVNQEKTNENQNERMVTFSFIDSEGNVITTPRIISYQNGRKFDSDIMPELIDGYHKVNSQDGLSVSVDNNSNIYLNDNKNINKVNNMQEEKKSVLAIDRENNLTGNTVNLSNLQRDGIVEVDSNTNRSSFEEVTTEESNELNKEKPKVYVYENENNNLGISNIPILVLFSTLAIMSVILIALINLI